MAVSERIAPIGGLSRPALLDALGQACVRLNTHARTLLDHPDFDDPPAGRVQVVTRRVQQLGLDGGTHDDIVAAARRLNLATCPMVSGPFLRLAMLDQDEAPDSVMSAGRAPTGSLLVLTPPLFDDDTEPRGFYLRVVDSTAWLRGYRCVQDYRLPPEQLLALASP